MFRFRRYRVFVVFAIIAIVLFIRLTKSRNWTLPQVEDFQSSSHPAEGNNHAGSGPIKTAPPAALEDDTKGKPVTQTRTSERIEVKQTTSAAGIVKSTPKSDAAQVPEIVLPNRKPIPPTKVSEDETPEGIHAIGPPSRQEPIVHSAVPTVIHWVKQTEHFPIAAADVIHLPTGTPIPIPKIQHKFNDETPDAKINREKRQTKVKEEFLKAWTGYKTKAWMHDELTPETGSFKDPFCGWAATLVDGLDTLWIMGLHEEFEAAVQGVKTIDFTTTVGERGDIPLFETTIRYLGGLIAAYDVSGSQYKILITKAEELAQILMGAFDTPNRMPELYYHWKPTFASQAKMASKRSSLAELGSLSMEFTRLAQLTNNQRYYDAVARITNALAEWQDRGTPLGSVFPDNVDASGCNRTATAQMPMAPPGEPAILPGKSFDEPVGYQPDTPANVPEPRPNKKPTNDQSGSLELQVVEGQPGTPAKGHIAGWGEDSNKKVVKRQIPSSGNSSTTTKPKPTIDTVTGLPLDIPAAKAKIGFDLGDGWGCEPQGLMPPQSFGLEKFSMGGGQDSTYEYFPKQHLLLGGLEPKYKKLYLNTIKDIKEWMLYRPMVPDNRDILFAGSVTTQGNPKEDSKLMADVEHLTCFIGGMVGMSARIFGLDEDLEIAKKLTDGCVWAYESTATGIMPEGATVCPCESATDCTWNQTAYNLFIDPMGATRDQTVLDYDKAKAEQKVQEAEAEAKAKEDAAKAAEAQTKLDAIPDVPANSTGHDYDSTNPKGGSESLKKEKPISLEKRGDVSTKSGESSTQESLKQKSDTTEAELEDMASSGRQAEMPMLESKEPKVTQEVLLKDPFRPVNHTQYVKDRIESQNLPPGFVTLKSNKYILRPEAIESVWYMYRITGDPIWQEKGWTMFEAIIKATSVQYGHAAIYDVLDPQTTHVDSMESFWLAETLKYFYLLYSTPDTISLDDWVLNTEAHPFKRPT